jgi:hypothetical protein
MIDLNHDQCAVTSMLIMLEMDLGPWPRPEHHASDWRAWQTQRMIDAPIMKSAAPASLMVGAHHRRGCASARTPDQSAP